jgi:hypothetical protein
LATKLVVARPPPNHLTSAMQASRDVEQHLQGRSRNQRGSGRCPPIFQTDGAKADSSGGGRAGTKLIGSSALWPAESPDAGDAAAESRFCFRYVSALRNVMVW